MNWLQKRRLRNRYLKTRNELDRLMEGYDCGITVASFINPRIGVLSKELDKIEEEVKKEMEKDAAKLQ